METNDSLRRKLLAIQQNEITEHLIYRKLAHSAKGEKNRRTLAMISEHELKHYNFWKSITGTDVPPSSLKVSLYYYLARFLGMGFGLQMMEKGELSAQETYSALLKHPRFSRNPSALSRLKRIIADEELHEEKLMSMLELDELKYAGSVVLGLNDALVELTGALAGLTFAIGTPKIIAAAGLLTGIAASLSMAASEYLSTKEEGGKDPLKASAYTGIAYIFTVLLLILPFFLLANPLHSLAVTLAISLIIIFAFNFYTSVALNRPFKRKFLEMAAISLGVAAISFIMGSLVKTYLGT